MKTTTPEQKARKAYQNQLSRFNVKNRNLLRSIATLVAQLDETGLSESEQKTLDYDTAAQAELSQKIEQYREAIALGDTPEGARVIARRGEDTPRTWAAAVEPWLRKLRRKGSSKDTVETYREGLAVFLSKFGDQPCSKSINMGKFLTSPSVVMTSKGVRRSGNELRWTRHMSSRFYKEARKG